MDERALVDMHRHLKAMREALQPPLNSILQPELSPESQLRRNRERIAQEAARDAELDAELAAVAAEIAVARSQLFELTGSAELPSGDALSGGCGRMAARAQVRRNEIARIDADRAALTRRIAELRR